MDLEKVALEAVRVKISEIFDKISVTANMEGKSIILRINLPDEIMNVNKLLDKFPKTETATRATALNSKLDQEAQQAQDELLGTQTQENA